MITCMGFFSNKQSSSVRFNYLNYSRLFFVQSIRVMNLLPPDIKSINSSNNFKNAVNEHFNRY